MTVDEDPFARFAELRANGPVARMDRMWLALDYRGCARVLADHACFSSDPRTGTSGPGAALSMLTVDPPEHARLRSATTRALAAGRVSASLPALAETARRLVGNLADGPEVELMAGVAQPMAELAIADVLAIPDDLRPSFRRWSRAVMAVAGRGTNPTAGTADEDDVAELKEHLRRALRRRLPADSLLGVLGAEVRATKLTDDEAVAAAVAVLIGGIGTTAHLIGNAAAALIGHESSYSDMAADRRLLARAVDETLRHSPPVLAVPRWARCDIQLEGCPIEAGSVVLAVLGAANRDPEVHPAGSRFDLRETRRHPLSFGRGPHHCPGRALSLGVARTTLGALADRFPELAPAHHAWVERAPSMFVYGPVRVLARVDGGYGRVPSASSPTDDSS
jgi:cytochrome P450